MNSSSSTLVATVSINYEDFTEGFLTCGTCLCAYDQAEHAPKLLSCSHTICQSCLELIASSPTLNNNAEPGCINCPICRQNISIPNGGIGALPPSFLVNQLFDLVNKKPREFIPKCSVHIEQELLFCETCDCVFCDTCNKTNTNNESDSSNSTTATTTDASLSTTAITTTSTTLSTPSATSSTIAPAPATATTPRRQQQQRQQVNNSKQHISEACTVIPFSTAIKRMSEILNYRSQQCSGKLDEARDNVQRETDRLESNCSEALKDIEVAFEKIRSIVDEREKHLLEETNKLHEYKKNVLLEQLKTIEAEKASLSSNCSVKINNETDVKNLSKKISDLSEKNDTALALYTPRENCFIRFENENDEAIANIKQFVDDCGKIRTSKTYPPYCTSSLVQYSTHLRSTALVQSIDYDGNKQKIGGDPIQAELRLVGHGDEIDGEIKITDRRDGTYEVSFVPPVPGKYQLFIYIFNRPIKDCPLKFETNSHHDPVAIYGQSSKRGVADQFDHFSQPASLTINKHNGRVYILDSFNNRIKVLAQIDSQECPFSFMQHIQPDCFKRSCTGIALLYPEEDDNCEEHAAIQTLSLSPTKPPNPSILVTDWRSRSIYELNSDGKLVRQYTHDDLIEPTNIVVDSHGRIFVVDRESIFVFNSSGKLLHKLIGYKYSPAQQQQRGSSAPNSSESRIKKCSSLISDSDSALGTKGRLPSQAVSNLLMSTVQQSIEDSEKEGQNKAINNGTATLNTYLAAAAAAVAADNNTLSTGTGNNNLNTDKRPTIDLKTSTLSSLVSMKRKPKLNPSSSLQRGSRAVMSAASKIRSTFTLSHSTSLVSAASLQSMFHNSGKQHNSANLQQSQLSQQQQQQVVAGDDNNFVAQTNIDSQRQQQQSGNNNSNSTIKQNKGPQQLEQQRAATIGSRQQQQQQQQQSLQSSKLLLLSSDATIRESGADGGGLIAGGGNAAADAVADSADGDLIELFGVIRGIAIGPDDELIVADEYRVRVLQPGDESFVFKRELFAQPDGSYRHHHHHQSLNNHHHNHHSHQHNAARLCAMTYDAHSKLLLTLHTSLNASSSPYIRIVDYQSGKTKFIIDSHGSKLMRPSGLATFEQHVIVSDLGNDCIKKYRFY